jgi:hypothetical protein
MGAIDVNALELGRELGVAEARYEQLDDVLERLRSVELFLARFGYTGARVEEQQGEAMAAAAPPTQQPAEMPTLGDALPAIDAFMKQFNPAATPAPTKPGGSG